MSLPNIKPLYKPQMDCSNSVTVFLPDIDDRKEATSSNNMFGLFVYPSYD